METESVRLAPRGWTRMELRALVLLLLGFAVGGALWAAGGTPAESVGGAVAVVLLADHLLGHRR